ncbi:MAG: helix-turn-helix transcriptional regulator [Clostridia bacterium]|nr:helix-turn-helix transcriptional regulator [Clostridia bacterium]
MDQIKTGQFIAECRKKKGLTQMQLAEKLNITDRAISKWERGKSLPDSAIMLPLCAILGISVNELLSGEYVMEKNNEKSEQLLLEMAKQKEQADKRLLAIEIVVGVISISVFFALVIFASYVEMKEWLRVVLILIGFAPLVIAVPFMLKIEQMAGYYECQKCGHRYVPTFRAVNLAMHMGRTRYMRCPECKQKSWQKKVLTKE